MSEGKHQLDQKVILLIDDEQDIRDMLSIMISRFDYHVITAKDYTTGIKQPMSGKMNIY